MSLPSISACLNAAIAEAVKAGSLMAPTGTRPEIMRNYKCGPDLMHVGLVGGTEALGLYLALIHAGIQAPNRAVCADVFLGDGAVNIALATERGYEWLIRLDHWDKRWVERWVEAGTTELAG